MPQTPDVLVIIVNYKTAALTVRAVESVAAERRRNPLLDVRAIVVENASGDEAALREGLGQRFADWLTLDISPTNGGYGAGNNRAMRAAFDAGNPPRYFHILNPDTEVRTGGIIELVRFCDAHPRAGIAGSCYENADGSDWKSAFRFPSAWSELEEGLSLSLSTWLLKKHVVRRMMGDEPDRADWLPGASVLFRREMIEAIGGFDEEFFLYFEETDLAVRAARAGWETWYVPASRVMHIAGASTGVTSATDKPRRLPRYWYESRHRFFSKNHGLAYTALADLAFLAANTVGSAKRKLRGQPTRPHLLRDFAGESLRFLRARTVAPERIAIRPASGR